MWWVSKKNRKKFGNEAQQTVEKLALEEDLDYSGKRKSVDLENQDALGISVQEREGYATWSGGNIPSSQEFSDKTKKKLEDFTKQKEFCRKECIERLKRKYMTVKPIEFVSSQGSNGMKINLSAT